MTDEDQFHELYEKHGGDLEAVASELGLNSADLDAFLPDVPAEPLFISETRVRPENLGRASMRPFLISVRHIYEPGWPRADKEKLEQARRDYDAGLVELIQGRDGNWILQYRVWRKQKARARSWFTAERAV